MAQLLAMAAHAAYKVRRCGQLGGFRVYTCRQTGVGAPWACRVPVCVCVCVCVCLYTWLDAGRVHVSSKATRYATESMAGGETSMRLAATSIGVVEARVYSTF